MASETDREVIYVADPCCSWCWGFSPTIKALKDEFEKEVKFTMRMGGLRVGAEHVRDQARKDYVRETWSRVGDLTGQPFNLDVLEFDDMSENTEPGCRALIVMRAMAPDKTFAFMERLQYAFFADTKDITKDEVLADLAAEEGEERANFLARLTSGEAKEATENEFAAARAMGVNGYPTTIVRNGDNYKVLSAGYRPKEGIRQFFDYWMQQD